MKKIFIYCLALGLAPGTGCNSNGPKAKTSGADSTINTTTNTDNMTNGSSVQGSDSAKTTNNEPNQGISGSNGNTSNPGNNAGTNNGSNPDIHMNTTPAPKSARKGKS